MYLRAVHQSLQYTEPSDNLQIKLSQVNSYSLELHHIEVSNFKFSL